MKRITVLAVIALLSISSIQAQPKDCNWHDRMMSEKIAFLTAELDLTPEEAQVFWPVYNQISEEKFALQKNVKEAHEALKKSVAEGTASDKEIDKLLDEYIAAKEACNQTENTEVDRFRKVLPSKKVAKLYVAEEKFRRQHIRNMKGGDHGKGPGPRK